MDCRQMTRKQAQAYFEDYMARREPALDKFRNKLAEISGLLVTTFDYSVESLLPLWTHLRKQLKWTDGYPPLDQVPSWYKNEVIDNPHNVHFYISVEVAHLVDGFAYSLGEVYIRNIPGCTWDFGKRSKLDYVYHRPYIAGPYFAGTGLMRAEVFTSNAIKTPEFDSDDDLYKIIKEEVEEALTLRQNKLAAQAEHPITGEPLP